MKKLHERLRLQLASRIVFMLKPSAKIHIKYISTLSNTLRPTYQIQRKKLTTVFCFVTA